MSDEPLEKQVYDWDYQNALYAMDEVFWAYIRAEQYENAAKMYWSWKRITEDYIDFRLTEFDSEARKVISKTYKILGYNPNNPRQLKQ